MIDAGFTRLLGRLLHGRNRVLAAEQHAENVDVHRLLIGRDGGGHRVVVVAQHDAGVVVEHVQTAERLDRVLHRCLDRLLVGDVATHERCLASSCGDCLDGFVTVGQIGDHDLSTFSGEQLGADATQSRRCTRDQCHFPSQTIHGAPTVVHRPNWRPDDDLASADVEHPRRARPQSRRHQQGDLGLPTRCRRAPGSAPPPSAWPWHVASAGRLCGPASTIRSRRSCGGVPRVWRCSRRTRSTS